MQITLDNYSAKTCSIDFNRLPEALKKGDELTKKALQNEASAYKNNDTIKRVVDSYILKLNAHVGNENKSKQTGAPEPKKEAKQSSPKPTVKKATNQTKPASTANKVESLSEEQKFIKRYVNMHGKVRSRDSVMRLLSGLQRAILEKRIRKTSKYASEIRQIQSQLIAATERMGDMAEINIQTKYLENYMKIAGSNVVMTSTMLLKRFVALHGRPNVTDKVKRLIIAIENAIKKEKVSKSDPYYSQVNQALKALKAHQSGKTKQVVMVTSELNGIKSICGEKRESKTALNGVISSEELLSMDFETIGLQGKFRELIGDPSVGFTAMVYGQPKAGKSTLMLEFAQHLAVNHGKVLFVAIEEGYGYTLKEKIQRVGAVHPNLHFAEELPKSCSAFDFVFIDSVSRAGMELDDLVRLKKKHPKTAFVYIFHSTKEGKFRGGNEFAHEVDCIIQVRQDGIEGKGRFGGGQ